MDPKNLLRMIIREELNKIEANGEKVRLKSIYKRKFILTIALVLIALTCLREPKMMITPVVCVLAYWFIFRKYDPVESIAKQACEKPDTLIEDIIKGDLIK